MSDVGRLLLGDYEAPLTLIELSRLGLSFTVVAASPSSSASSGTAMAPTPRLFCNQHSTWFVTVSHGERDAYARELRHGVYLENKSDGQRQLLLPGWHCQRIRLNGAPLCKEYHVSVGDLIDAATPYFLLPIHASEAFIGAAADAANLVMIQLMALTRAYAAAHRLIALLPTCVSDKQRAERQNLNDRYEKRILSALHSDPHPDAKACLLALVLKLHGACGLNDAPPKEAYQVVR